MARTTVKICGLRTREIVQSVCALSVDQIGFVFAKSRRQVSPELVRELLAMARENVCPPQAFGVFVNPGLADLAHVLSIAPLHAVQLHGTESPEFCREVRNRFGVKTYKVFSVKNAEKGKNAADRMLPYQGVIDGAFIDTYDPVIGGGTGKAFGWDIIPDYLRVAEKIGVPLIIAGGLTAENVGRLLSQYDIHGVDVSSGVETDGEKDGAKIRQFVERVRNHDASSG
ncbi:MAG TPA: phosphoribosylanthranilate isomerase [Bacilli bacterium]